MKIREHEKSTRQLSPRVKVRVGDGPCVEESRDLNASQRPAQSNERAEALGDQVEHVYDY
jgi:hypothetical protein